MGRSKTFEACHGCGKLVVYNENIHRALGGGIIERSRPEAATDRGIDNSLRGVALPGFSLPHLQT